MSTQGWPRFEYERREWAPARGAMPRALAQELSGPYSSALAPRIAGVAVTLGSRVAADSDEATLRLTRLDGRLALQGMSPLAAAVLRSEAASSSQIEHVHADASDLAHAAGGLRASPSAQEAYRNVLAVERALAIPGPLGHRDVQRLQAALMGQAEPMVEDDERGAYREREVWIGPPGSVPTTAEFVAPHPVHLDGAMADWLGFVERVDIPALAHAAIAHAHFEGIHPFDDGNGRTGRALVQAMLRHRGVTEAAVVPVSAGLVAISEQYFDALKAYRMGYLEPIVEAFSQAALTGALLVEGLLADLEAVRDSWAARVAARSDAAVWALAEVLLSQPVVTAETAAEACGRPAPAVYRALRAAEAAGMVRAAGEEARATVWEAPEPLAALDDFLARTRVGR